MKYNKISLIIPVNNDEYYIEETLNNILNQTIINDIEVIMIDYGSTDSSRYIIEKYALDYDNFFAYHIQNEGMGIARNNGIIHAHGKYIRFITPMDFISPDSCEKLYNQIEMHDCDFIAGNAMNFDDVNIWDEYFLEKIYTNLDKNILISNLEDFPSVLWDNNIGNKLFKKEFLDANIIRFSNMKSLSHDLPFIFKTYFSASSFYMIKDVVYYQRVNEKNYDFNNIKKSLEILGICENLMNKFEIDGLSRDHIYLKWLSYDIGVFLKEIKNYPSNSHQEIIALINDFVKNIPSSVFDRLDSYMRILYEMAKNMDVNDLINSQSLENNLKNSPTMYLNIDDNYKQFIDFKKDALNEELKVVKTDIKKWNDNLLFEFSQKINYVDFSNPHKTIAKLVSPIDEVPLKISANNQIVIPLNLIKNKNNLKIKIIYDSDFIKKESFIKNNEWQNIDFDEYKVNVGIGENSVLTLDSYSYNDNEIQIRNIEFNNDNFEIKGNSKTKIDKIEMENLVTFKKYEYKLEYMNNEFSFSIPYLNFFKDPISVWELKNKNSSNSISICENFNYYGEFEKISFKNAGEKILIERILYDKIKTLNDLNDILNHNKRIYNDLVDKNKMLIEINEDFKKNIEEYKSRKIIKFGDKITKGG